VIMLADGLTLKHPSNLATALTVRPQRYGSPTSGLRRTLFFKTKGSSGGHTDVLVGGFLEVILALAGIGTAITLYPVFKRQNEGAALGLVAARVLEAVMIFTGVVSLLSLVTLRQDLGAAAGANAASLVTTGAAHVAIYHWTFLLSQSLMPGINALLLGSLMYQSRLVPRIIPVIGLIGAPLLICMVIATLFGGMKLGSPELAAVPVAAWELSLGGWLVVKGFRPCPITAEIARLPGRRLPGEGWVRLRYRGSAAIEVWSGRARSVSLWGHDVATGTG